MKRCPDMCLKYWSGHPFNTCLGLICPGCETWTDKDGKTWRRMNLPDGVEIRSKDAADALDHFEKAFQSLSAAPTIIPAYPADKEGE